MVINADCGMCPCLQVRATAGWKGDSPTVQGDAAMQTLMSRAVMSLWGGEGGALVWSGAGLGPEVLLPASAVQAGGGS